MRTIPGRKQYHAGSLVQENARLEKADESHLIRRFGRLPRGVRERAATGRSCIGSAVSDHTQRARYPRTILLPR